MKQEQFVTEHLDQCPASPDPRFIGITNTIPAKNEASFDVSRNGNEACFPESTGSPLSEASSRNSLGRKGLTLMTQNRPKNHELCALHESLLPRVPGSQLP